MSSGICHSKTCDMIDKITSKTSTATYTAEVNSKILSVIQQVDCKGVRLATSLCLIYCIGASGKPNACTAWILGWWSYFGRDCHAS